VSSASPAAPWLSRYAAAVAISTFLLIFIGGLVTSTGSGLAVPDWPLSFGRLFPRMQGGVLFEHGHRMAAFGVGLLTLVLALWLSRVEPRDWVRRLGWLAVAAVAVQGALGGLTVLLKLPDATSIAHAALAQIFFCLTAALAAVTSPRWADRRPLQSDASRPSTRALALATVVLVYAQILLGALVRHTGAGLVIPDFPLAHGRLWPEISHPLVAYQMAHRVGALIVVGMIAWTAGRVLARHGAEPALRRPALALVALAAFQVFLGALTIWTRKAVVPTTAHVATGAAVLVVSLLLAIRAQRLLADGPAVTSDVTPLARATA
jgi:cytochrome c oxidase assembly protein subunit 15